MKMTSPIEVLRRPYARVVTPEDDGSFRAEILEFPGCIAAGETEGEALAALARVAESWLESVIAKGLVIPAPFDQSGGYSGKFVLRLSKSLHRRAANAARSDGVSLNQYITTAIAVSVGSMDAPAMQAPIQIASMVACDNAIFTFAGSAARGTQHLASSVGQLADLWKTMNSRVLADA
jgi:antitoxin HicB